MYRLRLLERGLTETGPGVEVGKDGLRGTPPPKLGWETLSERGTKPHKHMHNNH